MQIVRIGLDLAKYVFEIHGVDAHGKTVVRKTLRRHAVSAFFANLPPCLIDKNPAYPRAVADMKSDGQLWRRTCLRQCKYLNNIVEQDHRRIKRLVRPGLGFGSFHTARRTLAGFETMAMMRKGQLRKIDGHDIRGQAVVIADLFDSAA